MESTWIARYVDGSECREYDDLGNEQPFSSIDWSRATELVFESDQVQAVFALVPLGPEYRIKLKARTFMRLVDGTLAADLRCFMICTERADAVVDLGQVATIIAATTHVTYWFPDGTTHECDLYCCPEVDRWVSQGGTLESCEA